MQLQSRKITLVAIFSAIAVVIYVVESFIPRPLPWLRFGFGNIIVLIALYLFGFKISLFIGILKSFLGALIVGNLFTPAFLFSLSGGIVSVSVMAIILSLFPRLFSPLGLSVWGAAAHNSTQLLIASILLVGKVEVMYLLPFFILLSVITGTITGAISLVILKASLRQLRISNYEFRVLL